MLLGSLRVLSYAVHVQTWNEITAFLRADKAQGSDTDESVVILV